MPRVYDEDKNKIWQSKVDLLLDRFDKHFQDQQIQSLPVREDLDSASSELNKTKNQLREIRNSITIL